MRQKWEKFMNSQPLRESCSRREARQTQMRTQSGSERTVQVLSLPWQLLRVSSRQTGQMESSGPINWEKERDSLLPQDQCSAWAGKAGTQEALKEAAGQPSSCSPSESQQVRTKECSPLLPTKARDDKQPFASTQRDPSELSRMTAGHEEPSGSARERQAEVARSPCFLLSRSPVGGSPSGSRLHSYATSSSSPSVPQPRSSISKASSPSSLSPVTPAKQRRHSTILTLLGEPGHQKGKRGSSMLGRRNRGILISPAKSPPSQHLIP